MIYLSCSFLVKPLLVTTWSYWTIRIWDNSRLAFNNLTKGGNNDRSCQSYNKKRRDDEQFSTWKAVFCYKVWLLIQESWKSEPKKEATLRIIGPSKLAILRTLTLLYRFVHFSIGGSKIRRVFKKMGKDFDCRPPFFAEKAYTPNVVQQVSRWFDSSEICIVCISLLPKIPSKWKL